MHVRIGKHALTDEQPENVVPPRPIGWVASHKKEGTFKPEKDVTYVFLDTDLTVDCQQRAGTLAPTSSLGGHRQFRRPRIRHHILTVDYIFVRSKADRAQLEPHGTKR